MQKLRALAIIMTGTLLLPVILIPWVSLQADSEAFRHIAETLLTGLMKNTLILAAGVLTGTLIIGVGSAWLTAACEFPGRAILNWALMLPLAVPAYVMAFVFIGLLDYAGPVQSFLRDHFSLSTASFPEIRSTGGVILVLSLALYPYVYLMARNAFQTQGQRAMEVSQALGYSRTSAFFKTALPMARPWIAGGLMLVLMETLADFGAVSVFNYDTFTTAVYKAWFGFFSLESAAQLASILLFVVLLVLLAEQALRRKMQFYPVGRLSMEIRRIVLTGWKKWAASGLLTAVVTIAFVVPFCQLTFWAAATAAEELDPRYVGLVLRTLFFAGGAACFICFFSLAMAYIQRLCSDPFTLILIRLSTLGYALPGTVLAVGIAVVVNALDRQLIQAGTLLFGLERHAVFAGSLAVVFYAYGIRFFAVGFNALSSAMMRITKNLDETSRLLGVTGWRLVTRVHVPILKKGLMIAAMMIFVDVMKEMPITLMTRPFGWETLAVKIFELTSEGEWHRAALPSLTLILAGLVPLIILNKNSQSAERRADP